MTANHHVEIGSGSLNLVGRAYAHSVYGITEGGTYYAPNVHNESGTLKISEQFVAYHCRSGWMPENMILGLTGSSSIAGTLNEYGLVLLRLRKDAPMLSITIRLPPSQRTPYQIIPAFRGRADILSSEEAESLGYALSATQIERMGRLDDIAQLFDITETAPGLSAAPVPMTVMTEEGVKTVVRNTTRIRRRRYAPG